MADRKVNKCEAIFHPPRADGNLCAQSAIFYPQGWKSEQAWGYFLSIMDG